MDADLLTTIFLFLTAGAVGGFLSGMLGIGGGIIFVPALLFILNRDGFSPEHVMHIAVASSLAIVSGAVMTSVIRRYRKGDIDMKIFRRWSPFLVLGVLSGSFFASRAESHILVAIFAVITALMAAYMFFGREPEPGKRVRGLTLAVQRLCIFLVGILAAMTGVGGAIMTIPMLSASGVPMQKAVGTGSLLGLLIAVSGAIGYMVMGWPLRAELPEYSIGYVYLPAVLLVAGMAVLAAQFGVKSAYALDKKTLRHIFAAILCLVSLKMFLSL
jgi:uncharacterized membrane protein YfcA